MALGLNRFLWVSIGTALLLVPFLPLTPRSGLDSGPVWWPHVQAWVVGMLSIAAVGAVAGRLTTALKRSSWPHIRISVAVTISSLAVSLFVAATFAMVVVFSSNPHLVDEIAQLFQARVYAAGRMAAPIPEFPEFFLFLNSFITQQGWVSQYPPGHPALLGMGLLVGLEWIVNPLLAGASVFLVFQLTRQLYGPRTALTASFLWATSGWVIFMSGTYQNHVSAAAFALLAWVAVLGLRRVAVSRGVLCGVALGILGTIRPLDTVAASLPVLFWVLYSRQWRMTPWILLGGAPFVAVLAFVNWKSFGHPTMFGYTALYGVAHGLGFHTDPYGWAFTPFDALRNLFYVLRRVHIYLFEWPIPAALPIGVWAFFGKQKRKSELVVAVGILSLPLCYFFYWHSGYYIGPRFYYGITPFLAIATARAWIWGRHTARKWNVTWFRPEPALRWCGVAVLLWGFVGPSCTRNDSLRRKALSAPLFWSLAVGSAE